MKNGHYAVHFLDNSIGDADTYWMFAYYEAGTWYYSDRNLDMWELKKPLLQYENDAVLEYHPLFTPEYTDAELTMIYKTANNEFNKSRPLTTERIFTAMRAMLKQLPNQSSCPTSGSPSPVGQRVEPVIEN